MCVLPKYERQDNMQKVKSLPYVKWFQPQSRFKEGHFNRTNPTIAFDDEGKLQEYHHIDLKDGQKQSFYSGEYVYNDGSRSTSLSYYNKAKKKNRYCDKYDIIKYETGTKDGTNNKIKWNYTTDKSYGIGVVKEKNADGKWVAKIYEKMNYSHPQDSKGYQRFLHEMGPYGNRHGKFVKNFTKDVLIFDSTQKYTKEQINELLAKFELPQKAINIIKKALIH